MSVFTADFDWHDPSDAYQIVGYQEYANALNNLVPLVREADEASIMAFNKIISDMPELVIYTNLSRRFGFSQIQNSSLPLRLRNISNLYRQSSLNETGNDANAYRQNFEDILSFLDEEDSESHTIRLMINHISELLNLEYLPENFKLYQNYPNPFNPVTTISFDLKQGSEVSLSIYDIKGNMVYENDFGYLNPGLFNYVLDAKDYTSGAYIYSIASSSGFTAYKQMILIK